MLALYRSGRQAEALAAYREFRATLDEQLGLEPSARLSELEAAYCARTPRSARPRRHSAGRVGRTATSVRETTFAAAAASRSPIRSSATGPLDLVFVHGWVCSFHAAWERAEMARFYRRLA